MGDEMIAILAAWRAKLADGPAFDVKDEAVAALDKLCEAATHFAQSAADTNAYAADLYDSLRAFRETFLEFATVS